MTDKLNMLMNFATSIGIWPAYMVYLLGEKLLPGWAVFSDSHVWWHTILLAVFWIGLYLASFYGIRMYIRQQLEMLNKRAWYSHDMKMFSGLSKWLCLAAVLGSLLVAYLELPPVALLVTAGCGVAVVVYDVIKARLGAPFILLQQFYLTMLTITYYILFSPILFALYVLWLGLMFFGITLNDIMSPQIVRTTYFSESGTPVRSETETM